MSGSDELSLIAELALGYAGFMAIFLVFTRQEGRFNAADAFRIRSIVAVSFTALFGSLIPLLIGMYGFDGPLLWTISSAIIALIGLANIIPMVWVHWNMNTDQRMEVGRLYSILAWGLIAVAEMLAVINAFGILGESSAATYVAAMVCLLGVATVNFVAITFRRFF